MKQIYLILLMMLLSVSIMFGQIYTSHVFSASTGTYTEIAGTTITEIQVDDALSGAINIGFTFLYGIEPFTQVKVSSNGWIGLGTLATEYTNWNSLSSETEFPFLAPLWDDISLASGTCKYTTTGTAPTRVFTVQYQNAKWDYNSDNQFNFQVKLYENGKIEFAYGSSTGTPTDASASIGININPGGLQNYYSITPGTPASASFTNENSSVGSFPANGVIYTFDIVAPVPNDLAAFTITGNLTPTAAAVSNYTIPVSNLGTATQSNYTVKIMNGANVLASIAGPTIAPGATQNVVVPWTPVAAGNMTINGKVVLAGDAYPQNDVTSPLDVVVQPAGTIVVTVGAGDEVANMPVNMYWKNSLFETIYMIDEIGTYGALTGVSFYNNFFTNLTQKPTKIWMGNTQQSDLSTGWIPSTDLIQVFDGNVDYPSGPNTITIPFPVPYVFAGGNLVMMVQRPTDTVYFSPSDQFYCQTVGTNRTRHVYNDQNPYDPANPPAQSELTGQFPKTSFYFASIPVTPQFGVAPESKNYGTLLMNSTASQTFSVFNMGGASLNINSISITGSQYFSLQNLPTLPVTLASMQITTFVARYNPTAAGNHTATITITDNLNRTQHTVTLTGVCMDPTIYASPYFQNFDSVTVPYLPLDWNKLYVPIVNWGYIQTETNSAHSNPNCMVMYNSESVASDMLLIAPPLAQSLTLPAMRVKFWAKGFTGTTLKVGVIADITDAETFSSVSTLNLTGSWAEYVVSFQTYEGAGRYIAFKHGNSNTYEEIFIDDVMIENIPQNDLAALSITGSNTPSINSASTYTVTLFNWGTNPQSNYTVKLYKTGNIELASVAGSTINPGLQATATLTWTPTVAENTFIYGKVILNGDQNNLNDQTSNMNILVMSSGTSTVTIGSGSQSANIPVSMYSRNSLYETIFNSADITSGGSISGIAFFNNFISNLPQKPTKIWLGSTEQTNLSAGWIPSTQMTLVFDGLVDYPSGANTVVIPFTTPFPYIGTNLVMMVNRPMDTSTYNFGDQFYAQTIGTNTSLNYASDWETLDPANPPSEWLNLSGQFPKTSLFFVPTGPNPQFGVAPANKNFGTVLLNTTNQQVFTVFNSGGAPLTINSIAISGSTMYSLQNMPTLPIVLNSGQNTTFTARYLPTAAGNHAAVVTITDNQMRTRTPHSVNLTAICADPTIYTSPYAQNFDSVTVPALPIDWQQIYQAENVSGVIQSVTGTASSNPNSIQLYNSENDVAEIILIAPPLVGSIPVVTTRVKFKAYSWNNCTLDVGVISNPTNPATFQSISTITATSVWNEFVVSFQTYTGTGQFIAFKHGMGGTYRSIYIDDVTIETIPQNDLAAVTVTGNTTPSIGMTTSYTVNLFNWGMNPQSSYTVKLFKEGDIEIASVPGTLINPGLTGQAVLSWTPTVQGVTSIYGKVLLTGDQNNLNNQTPNLGISVQPSGTMIVTVGDGSETARMPVDFYWHNSLNETIYLSSELNFIGMITGITLYNDFFDDRQNMPTKIWMGTTTQSDLSSDWIPSTQLTSVFDGTVSYPEGVNEVHITFPVPFLYLQDNLVVMFNRPMDGVYYSSEDFFLCQTVGTNRARNIFSDDVLFDPSAPPTEGATITGQFAKSSFYVIPGGVGHLTGNVYGASNVPLNNATVQIVGGAQVTTNAQGHYLIQNIIADTYDVTVSKFGYTSQTVSVVIPEDITVTQNFTLIQLPTVIVTGLVVGSDNPAVGLPNSTITLTGMENYTATTNAAGLFTITGVYGNQTYQYVIIHAGYQVATGTLNVGNINQNMGTLTLNEIAYSPANVGAAINNNSINVTWLPPDPNGVDITEDFENTTFPPTDWTNIITDTGVGANGVAFTWCRFGEVVDGTTTVTPPEGSWQCGFWWHYQHQDEWLITPQFNCPQSAHLTFDSYVFQGSTNGDHYYVKITNNNGIDWTILWDASTLTGGWNNYQTPIMIDLSAYAGQQVKIAWHADDNNNEGMWHNWFIDDVVINNVNQTVRFSESSLTTKTANAKSFKSEAIVTGLNKERSNSKDRFETKSIRIRNALEEATCRDERPIHYKVWRLVQGQEQNEQSWVSLTPVIITATAFVDTSWPTLVHGVNYKWAVKAVYTGGIMSPAAFSNSMTVPNTIGTLTGTVRNANNIPVAGATISVGTSTAISSSLGIYTMQLFPGTYAVTCAATGLQTQTLENIIVINGQSTTCNFNMTVGNTDIVNVSVTALKGNFPNPFNPVTNIRFDIKTIAPVRIDIYNTKGQLIRTLVNEVKANGHYNIVWNGKDNNGTSVASGIYYYRMQAGNYRSTKRMMLMK